MSAPRAAAGCWTGRSATPAGRVLADPDLPHTRSSHVSGEEDALKLDALVTETKAMFEAEAVPGYSGIVRTVCKAEWGAPLKRLLITPAAKQLHPPPAPLAYYRRLTLTFLSPPAYEVAVVFEGLDNFKGYMEVRFC